MGLDDMVREAQIKENVLEMMTALGGGADYSIIEKYSFEGSEVSDAILDALEQGPMTYQGYSFAFHMLKHANYLSCLGHRTAFLDQSSLAPEDVKLSEIYTRQDILEHVARTTTDEALRKSIEDYLAHVMPQHVETAQAEARNAALPPNTGTWGSDPAA